MTVRFSASSAARLMACPASADLSKAIPNWVDPVRDETMGAKAKGTSVHKIIEELIGIETVTPSRTVKFSAKDMLNVARLLQYIGELWSTRRFKVLSEVTVTADWLQTKPRTTADLVFHTADEIHVLDTKIGKIHVEVIENIQLLYYAMCYAHLAPKAKGVTVHILQPWADNMASWFIPTARLQQFMLEAQAAEQKIIDGDTTFGPSDHGCQFCPAYPHSRGDKGRPLCPATMQILYPDSNRVDEDAILSL